MDSNISQKDISFSSGCKINLFVELCKMVIYSGLREETNKRRKVKDARIETDMI